MRSIHVILGLGALLLVLAFAVRSGWFARKNPGKPINSAMRAAMEEPQLSTEDALIIAKRWPTARKLPSGLMYVVHAPGEGMPPLKSQIISVKYTGTFLDGSKFDASADHGGTFNFQVGMGRVIAGWDEAFLGMKPGEKRTIILPYWIAYGEKGRGKIPPKATLVFDVELVGVSAAGEK